MDKTIVLDCQANSAFFSCEDCIVFKECNLCKKSNRKTTDLWEADMEIFANINQPAPQEGICKTPFK